MYKGNVLKAAWNTVNTEEVKVIDSNAMLEKRIREANALLQEQHSADEIPMDIVDGVDAFSVANLLGDKEGEENADTVENDEAENDVAEE